MITNNEFLKQELEWGISADNPQFIALADATIDQIVGLPIKSVLDYGAGVGVYADAAHRRGYDVHAYDIWEAHRQYMSAKFPNLKQASEPITTDLMLYIEVAEHMTDDEIASLFSKIAPKYILFSSTPDKTDNDEAWGHINIKQTADWDQFWEQKGYKLLKTIQAPTSYSRIYENQFQELQRLPKSSKRKRS